LIRFPAGIATLWLAALVAAGSAARGQEPAPTTSTTPVPAATPPAAAAPAATPEPPAPERITFDLKVPAEKGGGTIQGAAGTLESLGDQDAVASGGVEIRYKDLTITAEKLVLHRQTMTVEGEGDVIFDQGTRRIAAERVDFDLVTQNGTFWKATAFVDPDYYFTGDVVSKTGPDRFEVKHGSFTSCTGDRTADWSFRMSTARVDVGDYAHVHNASMWVKKLPVFYWPYILWPVRTERTSGFLIPNIGYTDRKGAYLGLAYFQVLGPSYDDTIYLDGYAQGFYGGGDEFRYRPTDGTRGQVLGYAIHDPDADDWRWKVKWTHESKDLPLGLRGVVSFEDYSDFNFFRDFERREYDNTKPWIYSNAFVSGNWGPHSLNLLVDRRETFAGEISSALQEQLPELQYRLRKLKLGRTPLYLSLDSTLSYLASRVTDFYDVSYGRVDLNPQVTLPVRSVPWLSLSLTAGGKATWWGDSLPKTETDPTTQAPVRVCDGGPLAAGEVYCGDSLSRAVPEGSVDVVGPSFSRIFNTTLGSFAKIKHVIEPRFSYGYLGVFDDEQRVPIFDEIDAVNATNSAQVALVNRFLGKPENEEDGGAYEFLSLELSRLYSLDSTQPLQVSRDRTQTSTAGPIAARLRFNPSKNYSIDARASYNTLFSGLDSRSLTASANLTRARFGLTWFTRYSPELEVKNSDQVRVQIGLKILPGRLSLDSQINYDLKNSEIQQQRYFLNYNSQCWSVNLEAREQVLLGEKRRDYRLSLTLKNVGTFLDLSSGQTTTP
jgi:LPS-assembly protein